MHRIIEQYLTEWKARARHKPLIIRGARQVGKTYIISSFGKTNFSSFLRIDLERDMSARRCFDGDLAPKLLIPRLEVQLGAPIIPGSTLLFFDEIQKCPRALTSLRYFHEEYPQLHIVAAGSLLELALNETSFPVGSVEFAWMRPLSFAEFIEALGNRPAQEHLIGREQAEALPDSVHGMLLSLLKAYFIVGGMPEAVIAYLDSNSFIKVSEVHRTLMQSYVADIQKHCSGTDTEGLDRLLANIPLHTGKPVKYTHLEPDWRVEKIKRVLSVLEKTLIVNKVRSTQASGLPLGATASEKIFKLIFMDIGLMQHMCGLPPVETLESTDLLSVYRGALAEQFVGQEILAGNLLENEPVYCWMRAARNADAEVDYILIRNGHILPVEVKSGAAGKLKSMHVFLQEHPQCEEGIVLSSKNVRIDRKHRLRFLPLYTRL
jgi:hypothetical protein